MKKKVSDLQNLIDKSGNVFHYTVVNHLRDRDWTVLVSPYYSDYMSDKSKEIDIIAEKQFPVYKGNVNKESGFVTVQLFVECKYLNSEIVAWFDRKDTTRAQAKIIRETPLKDENIYTERHHYLSDSLVAKVFTPNSNKEDVFYKAITQALNAMIYHQAEGLSPIFPSIARNLAVVKYPVIVCNDFKYLYRIDPGQTAYSPVIDQFQIEVNYAYLSKQRTSQVSYFLIDVVNFQGLDSFLDGAIKTDVDSIRRSYRRITSEKLVGN